jgi:AcrR family transcriptional regulator
MATYARLTSDDRRARLLELGVRLFSERPYDEYSMDELAAQAGVSKGLLYHYFPSKREYYVAALRTAAAEMLDLTEPDPSAPPEEQLVPLLEAYLAYVLEHSSAYRAVLRGGIGTDAAVAGIAEEVRLTFMQRVLDQLGTDQPPPRLRVAVRGWIGLVEASSLDWIEHRDLARKDLAQLLADALLALINTANAGQ